MQRFTKLSKRCLCGGVCVVFNFPIFPSSNIPLLSLPLLFISRFSLSLYLFSLTLLSISPFLSLYPFLSLSISPSLPLSLSITFFVNNNLLKGLVNTISSNISDWRGSGRRASFPKFIYYLYLWSNVISNLAPLIQPFPPPNTSRTFHLVSSFPFLSLILLKTKI